MWLGKHFTLPYLFAGIFSNLWQSMHVTEWQATSIVLQITSNNKFKTSTQRIPKISMGSMSSNFLSHLSPVYGWKHLNQHTFRVNNWTALLHSLLLDFWCWQQHFWHSSVSGVYDLMTFKQSHALRPRSDSKIFFSLARGEISLAFLA